MGDPLPGDLLEAIGQLRRQARRITGRPFPDGSLSNAQFELMRHVRRNPGTSVAEAAAELGLAANTVSTLVTQLVEAGVVTRTPDPADKRVNRLQLTPAAQKRVERWRDQRAAALGDVMPTLSAADRRALERAVPALLALATAMRERTEGGAR